MSRIAKTPVTVPNGVEVTIAARSVTAKGPKGELSLDLLPGVDLTREDDALVVGIIGGNSSPSKRALAMSGTTRALVYNLVRGVSEGFEKRLSIAGVGYRAQAQGARLNLSLGFSHPVVYQAPAGVTVETPSQTDIVVRGASKQQVGQVAAEIRAYRPPEPYKGKGIRYADEIVRRKQAKKK
ncbi:MAG: 50S ribosomal protein L6 [Gammaproteobacteria bacterium]|nr:50S ribosomal protein L6 [Gammaproteobacteria bacterium]MDD9823547.1 50S ribosomal protein L6 [Gammaproteobacteria bacterium]